MPQIHTQQAGSADRRFCGPRLFRPAVAEARPTCCSARGGRFYPFEGRLPSITFAPSERAADCESGAPRYRLP